MKNARNFCETWKCDISYAFVWWLNCRVIGEKEGYLLSGPFENGVFKAHKLAEVQVKLTDDEDKPLQVRI